MRHPKETYILFIAEAWDRFSYYGLQAILVLYFIKIFLYTPSKSYSLYGVYATMGFATPIFGGYIADHYLSKRLAMIVGCVCIIIGNLMLISHSISLGFLGISFALLGTGLFKPSATSLLGTLYKGSPQLKGSAYTIFYMGMNVGAILGPLVFGLLIKYAGWHAGFIVSAIGFACSLILIIARSKSFKESIKVNLKVATIASTVILVIIFILALLPKLLNIFIVLMAIAVVIFIVKTALSYHDKTRSHIFGIAILALIGIFYYAASIQTGSSVTLFINAYVNRSIFGWQIPTVAFLSLEPLWIILVTPLVIKIWRELDKKGLEPKTSSKLLIGLFMATLSFILFYYAAILSAHNVHSHWPLFWIVIANLTLGIGELALMPAIMTAISESMPEKLSSTMMGVWFLSVGFAGYFASLLSKLTIPAHAHVSPQSYAHGFLITAIVTFCAGILLILIAKIIAKLLR